MRPPYPVTLVPLLPQFLLRRRARSDFPLRHMEKLGVDRPAYAFAMDVANADPRGARPEDIGNSRYRTTDELWRGAAAAAQSAGLVEQRDGRWSLSDRGRTAVDELRRNIDAYFAGLSPIAADELERLATLLDAALLAASTSPAPATRDHTPRGGRYRWQEPSSPMARLDAAIYGLWQVRDDCHVQAWRDAGLAGPVLDIMTRIWRNEAATEAELAPKIPTQRPEDVRAALDRMRVDGLLTGGPDLALTPAGLAKREAIEAATDRYFFSPWPDEVAREADWVQERLAAVNTALA